MRNVAASFLAVAVFYAGTACSADTKPNERDSFISQLCAEYMPCCTKAGKPGDGARCRALYDGLTSGSAYDAAAAKQCLDEVRAQSSSPTFCEEGIALTNAPSCPRVFNDPYGTNGTKLPGETCNEDDDCAPSAEGKVDCRSLTTGGMTIKKCQVQIVGKAGDTPCVGTVDGNVTSYSSSGETDIPVKGYLCYVKDGLRCDSTTSQCKPIANIGEPCVGFGSCVNDAYCDTTQNKCVAKKPAGQPCETYGNQCAEGTYCNSTTKVCTAALPLGAACTTSQECGENRCVNNKCEKSNDITTSFLCGN